MKAMARIHLEGLRWNPDGDVVETPENSQVCVRIDGAEDHPVRRFRCRI